MDELLQRSENIARQITQFIQQIVIFFKYNTALHSSTYLFFLLLLYLTVGTLTIWAIERQFPFTGFVLGESLEDSLDRLWQDQYLSKEEWKNQVLIAFSRWADQNDFENIRRNWSLFDAAFFCYGLVTGTGCYSELEPRTTAGKLFTMIYTLYTVPLVLLLIGYLSELVDYLLRGLGTAIGKIADLIIELITDMPQTSGFDKFFFEQEEWWLYSVMLLIFYCGVGTWMFVYRGPYQFWDVFYSSFIGFATLNIGKPFLDANHAFGFLIYLLCGIAVFQNCIRVIQNDIRKWIPKLPHSPFYPSESSFNSGSGTNTGTDGTGKSTDTGTSDEASSPSDDDNNSSSEPSDTSKKKEKKTKSKKK